VSAAAVGADAVLVLHLGYILFVACGGLLVVWRPRVAWAHVPALAWGVWISVTHGICPLTPLENSLRHAAGEAAYQGSFIDHYVEPLIYPPGLTPHDQFQIAALLVGLNVLLYVWAAFRHRVS
jgi:hypothetical protein